MKLKSLLELRTAKPIPDMEWVPGVWDDETQTKVKDGYYRKRYDAGGNLVTKQPYGTTPKFEPVGKRGNGNILGAVGEWLKLMGANENDRKEAYEKIKRTPEYKHLIDSGYEDNSKPADIKNGTIDFLQYPADLMADKGEDRGYTSRVKIMANGNVGVLGRGDPHYKWRPKLPAPHTSDSHPNSTPVERIVNSMVQGLKWVIKTQLPRNKKEFLKALNKS